MSKKTIALCSALTGFGLLAYVLVQDLCLQDSLCVKLQIAKLEDFNAPGKNAEADNNAENLYIESLKEAEQEVNPFHPLLKEVVHDYVQFLRSKNRNTEAKQLEHRMG